MVSKYRVFLDKWRSGCGAEECSVATKVCQLRGSVPCDVLFTGEAPGPSEDLLGQPFVGPAGHLLNHIIEQSIPPEVRYGICNLVGCIPRDEDGNKAMEPSDEQVRHCKPRLEELVVICKPRLIVCVGKLAKDWLDPKYRHHVVIPEGITLVDIVHPAAILRANLAMKGLMVQRSVVVLRNAVEELREMKEKS